MSDSSTKLLADEDYPAHSSKFDFRRPIPIWGQSSAVLPCIPSIAECRVGKLLMDKRLEAIKTVCTATPGHRSFSLGPRAVSESAGGVMPVTQLGRRTAGARDMRLSSSVM